MHSLGGGGARGPGRCALGWCLTNGAPVTEPLQKDSADGLFPALKWATNQPINEL